VAQNLSYEEMLSQLQGLLGIDVTVNVQVRIAGRFTPIVMLAGVLQAGVAADLSAFEGEPTSMPGGESVLFWVGSDTTAEPCCFIVRKNDYKLGCRTEEGLEFRTGRVRVGIITTAE
jgi:hypothetical protein